MPTRNPLFLLALPLVATGCVTAENGPVAYDADELAAFMGTREERAARPPYSPSGWPLKPGDEISDRRRYELNRQFPRFCSFVNNVFWVGDMAFGAIFSDTKWFREHPGELPGYDDPIFRYLGHGRAFGGCAKEDLPPHVRDPSKALHWFANTYTGVDFSEGRPDEIWTEERWLDGYTGGGKR